MCIKIYESDPPLIIWFSPFQSKLNTLFVCDFSENNGKLDLRSQILI